MSVAVARKVAMEVLQRIEAADSYANLLLPQLVGRYRLDTRDAALAQELAFGTIRRKSTLEALVLHAAGRKPGDIDSETMQVLILGAYQLLLTRVPTHAAINESVDQAKSVAHGRSSGLVNAVLRKVQGHSWESWLSILERDAATEIAKLAIRYSHPEWIITALKLALSADGRVDELDKLLESDNEAPLVNLAAIPGLANTADTSTLEAHPSSPIGYVLQGGQPAALEAVAGGRMRVQDAGSQLVALAMSEIAAPSKGEKWLDLCAGPGGKSVLLAAMALAQQVELVCNEPSEHRANLVRDALENSGFRTRVTEHDGRQIEGTFTRILIDAPCTGLGALRRRPEARWRKSASDVKQLNALQLELVASAWNALEPGGYLFYSTCSPHPSETTSVIERSLRDFGPKAELVNATEVMERVSPTLRLSQGRKTVQLWPHRDDTDAMFLAIIRKSVS
jgi:16S rRNA (cytosine967-C5)-methyltransferase